MKVVILCGGKGVRYTNIYSNQPKALAPIGNRPILWHLFKYFGHFGYNDFILCLGNQGNLIEQYVAGYTNVPWNIRCVDTGEDTPTGGRVKMIQDYIDSDTFITTYVDGLGNIDLNKLVSSFHESGTIARLTAVRPRSQFGILEIDEQNIVTNFKEKPISPFFINGGFFIFNHKIFEYLEDTDILEVHTFRKLLASKQLSAYKHMGYWRNMDTLKDNMELDELWNTGKAEWAIWQ